MSDFTYIDYLLGEGMNAGQDAGSGKPGITDAVNVRFDREGVLRGRPGYTRDNLSFHLRGSGAGFSGGSSGTLATRGFTPRALVGVSGIAGSRPAVLADGRLWTREEHIWADRLGCWSTRVQRGAATLTGQVSPGTVTHYPSVAWDLSIDFGAAIPAALLTSDARAIESFQTVTNPGGNMPGVARSGTMSGVFWIDGNNLRLATRSAGGNAVAQYAVAADAMAIATVVQGVWASASAGATVFYVAYATTTANHVKVLRVNPATGAILTTLDVNFGNPVTAVCVDNSATRVVLAVTCSAGTDVRTKILDSTTLADQALDWNTNSSTVGTDAFSGLVCGAVDATNNTIWLAWRTSATAPSLDMASRSITAAAGSIVRTMYGGGTGGLEIRWFTVHAPILWNGRSIIGIAAGTASQFNQCTWFCLDVTDLATHDSFGGRSTLVARGPVRGTAIPRFPTGAILGTDQWRFASREFDTFDSTGGVVFSDAIIDVIPSQPAVTEAQGVSILGGSVPYEIAGDGCTEVGFPFMGGPDFVASATAGGAVTAGSYTLAAVWAWTDAFGRIHRSAPSAPVTVTTSAGVQTITYSGFRLQLTAKSGALGGKTPVWLEIYCSKITPSAFSALYLQTRLSAGPGGAVVGSTLAVDPVSNSETLYTTGGVLANDPPRCDGGAVTIGRRVWVAGQDRVLASKLLEVGKPPAWNEEGFLEVRIPASAGFIRSLGAVDDKLIVFCERGVYVTAGDGPDNLGIGPDFATPMALSQLGVAGPLCTTVTPMGSVFVSAARSGDEPGVHILDRSLVVKQIGRAVALSVPATEAAVSYWPEANAVLLGALGGTTNNLYLDLTAGRWSRWTSFDGALLGICASTRKLWQGGTSIGAYDGLQEGRTGDFVSTGQDTTSAAADFTMSLTTSRMSMDGESGLGWARCRGVSILGSANFAKTPVQTVQVDYDARENWVTAAAAVTETAPSTAQGVWPVDRFEEEYRLPQQKCSTLSVKLSAVPACAQWNLLRFEVKPIGIGRGPADQRK